jgi:hypothetical protein
MRKIISVVALLWLIGYVLVARNLALAPFEQQSRIGHDSLFFDDIDLSKQGTIIWNIPRDKWTYKEGDAILSLVVNNSRNLPSQMRDGSTLRVKIAAEGILDNGEKNNRLIRNWYYTTDQPFTDNPKLCESGNSDSREYGLAGISVYPFERLKISVQVLNGYAELQQLKPRLKLVGDTDYAIDEHLPFLRTIRDAEFVVSLIAALVLFVNSWRRDGKEKNTD